MALPIGFFAPLPLPMMIPFMGIQSAVMAEQFGTMFQYGKRRISAMSNAEFNALTPAKLQQDMTRQLQGMIPEMEKQIQAMGPMVAVIIKEFANYITLATAAVQDVATDAAGTGAGNIEYLLRHISHGHLPGIAGHPSYEGDTGEPVPTPTPTPTPTPDPVSDPGTFGEPKPGIDIPTAAEAKYLLYPSPFYPDAKLPLDRDGTVNMAILNKERNNLSKLLMKRLKAYNANRSNSSIRRLYDNIVKLVDQFQAKYGHRYLPT